MITPFYPPDPGGISVHVHKLCTLLSKKFEIKVLTNSVKRSSFISSNVVRVPSIVLPPFPFQTLSSLRIPITVNYLLNIIEDFDPDIIHAHGHHYPLTWLSSLIAKYKRIPFILTLHGMYALTNSPTLIEEFFNKTVLRWLTNIASCTIVFTKTMLSFVKKYNPHASCYIIPNGIDYHVFRNNLHRKFEYRRKYSLDEDKIIILYRGRFVEVKGFKELIYTIDVLNRIESIRSKVLFLLVGDGPLKEVAIKKLSSYTNCRLISWTPTELLHELYIASDIFVMPSKWMEAFSIVTLEAMASSLYIVSSKSGSLPEVLQRYTKKMYLESVTVRELAKTLLNVVNAWEEINNMKLSSDDEDYIRTFDWSKIINRVEQIYTMILKRF